MCSDVFKKIQLWSIVFHQSNIRNASAKIMQTKTVYNMNTILSSWLILEHYHKKKVPFFSEQLTSQTIFEVLAAPDWWRLIYRNLSVSILMLWCKSSFSFEQHLNLGDCWDLSWSTIYDRHPSLCSSILLNFSYNSCSFCQQRYNFLYNQLLYVSQKKRMRTITWLP